MLAPRYGVGEAVIDEWLFSLRDGRTPLNVDRNAWSAQERAYRLIEEREAQVRRDGCIAAASQPDEPASDPREKQDVLTASSTAVVDEFQTAQHRRAQKVSPRLRGCSPAETTNPFATLHDEQHHEALASDVSHRLAYGATQCSPASEWPSVRRRRLAALRAAFGKLRATTGRRDGVGGAMVRRCEQWPAGVVHIVHARRARRAAAAALRHWRRASATVGGESPGEHPHRLAALRTAFGKLRATTGRHDGGTFVSRPRTQAGWRWLQVYTRKSAARRAVAAALWHWRVAAGGTPPPPEHVVLAYGKTRGFRVSISMHAAVSALRKLMHELGLAGGMLKTQSGKPMHLLRSLAENGTASGDRIAVSVGLLGGMDAGSAESGQRRRPRLNDLTPSSAKKRPRTSATDEDEGMDDDDDDDDDSSLLMPLSSRKLPVMWRTLEEFQSMTEREREIRVSYYEWRVAKERVVINSHPHPVNEYDIAPELLTYSEETESDFKAFLKMDKAKREDSVAFAAFEGLTAAVCASETDRGIAAWRVEMERINYVGQFRIKLRAFVYFWERSGRWDLFVEGARETGWLKQKYREFKRMGTADRKHHVEWYRWIVSLRIGKDVFMAIASDDKKLRTEVEKYKSMPKEDRETKQIDSLLNRLAAAASKDGDDDWISTLKAAGKFEILRLFFDCHDRYLRPRRSRPVWMAFKRRAEDAEWLKCAFDAFKALPEAERQRWTQPQLPTQPSLYAEPESRLDCRQDVEDRQLPRRAKELLHRIVNKKKFKANLTGVEVFCQSSVQRDGKDVQQGRWENLKVGEDQDRCKLSDCKALIIFDEFGELVTIGHRQSVERNEWEWSSAHPRALNKATVEDPKYVKWFLFLRVSQQHLRAGAERIDNLDESRAEYAPAVAPAASSSAAPTDSKLLHREFLVRKVKQAHHSFAGFALLLEGKDATLSKQLIDSGVIRPNQLVVPNFDPYVCLCIKAAIPDARIFCSSLGRCILNSPHAIIGIKSRCILIWADYTAGVDTHAPADLKSVSSLRLPADKCVLAVTYTNRGGVHMQGRAKKAKQPEAKSALAAQTHHNNSQTVTHFNSGSDDMILEAISCDPETETSIMGPYPGKKLATMFFHAYSVRHTGPGIVQSERAKQIAAAARHSEELEREKRKAAAKKIVPKPLKPEERRSLEAKRDRLMASSEKTLEELCELGEAHFRLEEHDDALRVYHRALVECETPSDLSRVHTSMQQIYLHQGNNAKANSHTERALEQFRPALPYSPSYLPMLSPGYASLPSPAVASLRAASPAFSEEEDPAASPAPSEEEDP